MLNAMFDLDQLRRAKWQLDGRPVRTLDEAREFIESVGFCLMYPLKAPVLAPTFIGAWVGSEERLPTWQHAYADPRAQEATELMVRLLRERAAYEANPFDENNGFLVAGSIFPYFYALVGERNPKHAPQPGPRSEYSELVCDAYEIIRRAGPISKQKLLEALGGGTSTAALDKSLAELWSRLRITRVDYSPVEGSSWDCALPLVAGCGAGRDFAFGGGSVVGAAFEISGLRGRGRSTGNRSLFRQFRSPFAGEGIDQRFAGGAGVEFCARGKSIADPDHAGESAGGARTSPPRRAGVTSVTARRGIV